MGNKLLLVMFPFLLLCGCQAVQAVDQSLQTAGKKVNQTDARLRKKAGLKPYPYEKGTEPTAIDSH